MQDIALKEQSPGNKYSKKVEPELRNLMRLNLKTYITMKKN